MPIKLYTGLNFNGLCLSESIGRRTNEENSCISVMGNLFPRNLTTRPSLGSVPPEREPSVRHHDGHTCHEKRTPGETQ